MIVIDTHVWVWWQADPKRLSKKAARALKNAKSIGVPAICLWEFSMLVQRDRIRIDRSALEWLNDALDVPGRSNCRADTVGGRAIHSSPIDISQRPGRSTHRCDRAERGRSVDLR